VFSLFHRGRSIVSIVSSQTINCFYCCIAGYQLFLLLHRRRSVVSVVSSHTINYFYCFVADDHYYSESDSEEPRSAADRSSTDFDKLSTTPDSSPEKRSQSTSAVRDRPTLPIDLRAAAKANRDPAAQNSPNPVEPRAAAPETNDHVTPQREIASLQQQRDGGDSDESATSPSRLKPSVSSAQRRHKGDSRGMPTKQLSKSLDSLTADAELGNDGERIKKMKAVAAERVSVRFPTHQVMVFFRSYTEYFMKRPKKITSTRS